MSTVLVEAINPKMLSVEELAIKMGKAHARKTLKMGKVPAAVVDNYRKELRQNDQNPTSFLYRRGEEAYELYLDAYKDEYLSIRPGFAFRGSSFPNWTD